MPAVRQRVRTAPPAADAAPAAPHKPAEELPVEPAQRSKFEVGPSDERAPQQIPWSYGQDRVTAMVVDPDRLFVYWEVRDDSIAAARGRLGAGGPDAWLSLRLYDVTGRIFDGTNAHRDFDLEVQRTDRQWFVEVGQPESTWCVEVGMKSREGYFQRIARSGRADFPRRGPSARRAVEWMTVHVHSGEASRQFAGESEPAVTPGPGHAWTAPPPAGPREHLFGTTERETREAVAVTREMIETGTWEESREIRREWTQAGERLEWQGPVTRTTWEAGPFPLPVALPAYSEERWAFEGPVTIETVDGRTRIVHGPWQVVIRGIGAHAERRVLATWQIATSWLTELSRERVLETLRKWSVPGPGGASEGVRLGASERLLLRGSEIRLLGASELHLLGASERMWGGASEILFAGASEVRLRGASERLWLGASELRLLGASERAYAGASENELGGASEAFAGASEGWPRIP